MIEAPTNCPSCDSSLEWSNDLLYCRNTLCGASAKKQVEHFAKTLKIKGLGPSTIESLDLHSVIDIYELSIEEISDALGSEKIASKLFEEIEKSKAKKLNDVLPALGIPLIGATATGKLASVCSKIEDIDADSCKRAGLGPKATESLLNWLYENDWYLFLPHNLVFEQITKSVSQAGVVCISGKLTSFKTKSEAQTVLESLGYTVKSSITKDVTILVNEEGRETSKTQKARESGVLIVTDLKSFIGDNN